ncbi:uncharacterized protein [Palaemon carinicauda]|uniref:uncharacterized protein n=1 Tax=Palaemon carinicauda TaxID=392227 RepID=UPI0035B62199
MARPKTSSNFDVDKLSMLSLEEFLQEEIQPPSTNDDPPILMQPLSFHWDRGSWKSDYKKASRSADDEGRRGRGGRSFMNPRKKGVKPGVLMTHDFLPHQPLTQRSESSGSRPMESILTVGSHEAKSVKENVSANVDGEGEIDLEAVLTNAVPEQEVSFILNQKLPFEAGQKYHFLPVQDLNEVKRNTVLKLLVGFLNAGERGVIYMGVSEDGRVEGISAEHKLISQFVEGLMKTVQFYLMPRLHMPQYGVRYTNVLTVSGQILNNLWIVELHAVPQKEHYYNPVMDMTYYVRHGKETKALPFKEFCDMVVAESSRAFEPEIERLEERVRQLREELEAKGVDTSSAMGPHLCDKCWLNDCPVQCYGKVLPQEEDE